MEKSQFGKTILLIILSVCLFLGLKQVLPERLFPEHIISEAGMLIDSVLLEALNGSSPLDITDTVPLVDSIPNDSLAVVGTPTDLEQDTIEINPTPPKEVLMQAEANAELIATQASVVSNTIHPYLRTDLSKKLEKPKPVLFQPDPSSHIVIQKPIIDTLLDPSVSIQGYGYLQRFYAKLKNLEDGGSGRARVAYFGDSMNDGDFIVQDFRSLLQDQFGGSGVGFVAITSLSAASRGSVVHQHSRNWQTQSFVSVRRPSCPFGIDGQVFLGNSPGDTYWVDYRAGVARNSPQLYNPTLFYGQSDNPDGSVSVNINKSGAQSKKLAPTNTLNTLNLGASSANSVRVDFKNISKIPIYGLNFSSYTGVHVDNFSIRGNSGLPLSGFNTALMNAFDRALNYDLIVLHYGTNVLNYGSLDYTWYENNMTAVINKLRYCFPHADILVISTADKASKINMQMVTDPAVLSLTKAQKKYARFAGAGFIDLYNLMGGNGSMVEWVGKSMANKDYTHFNARGSREIGKLLFDEVERGYIKYKSQLEREKNK